ncbi:MAG TPA: pyridoxamine 5'-phosphate oxidase [Acidobacteriaceae bacterium]|jgi:pyridoxamine 5'-phosphate oxidase
MQFNAAKLRWPRTLPLDNTCPVDMRANEHDPFSPEAIDPLPCFHAWLAEARALEPNDPDAMALATATPQGLPSVRTVLLKDLSADGSFVFYTNAESRKGQEMRANPHAALCFHWKSLRRQIRIEGPLSEVSSAQADAYFRSRPRGSQLGAIASDQSRPLSSRAALEARAAELATRYPGEIPRPPHWTGFAVLAQTIEFWLSRPDRLHDRVLYTRVPHGWSRTLLYP